MKTIGEAWAVVWHVKGSWHVMQLHDLVETNRLAAAKGEPGYAVVALQPSMDEARARKRDLAREITAKREANKEEEQRNEAGYGRTDEGTDCERAAGV